MKQFVCKLCKSNVINGILKEDHLVADGYNTIFNATKINPYLDEENHEANIEENYVDSCSVRC